MSERTKVTLPQLLEMKKSGQKITMITAYDYPTGVWAERAGINIVLVGDSMAMTVLGYSTTLPATMAELISHSQAVTRGCKNSFILGDMPYMSSQPPWTGISGVFLGIRFSMRPVLTRVKSPWRYVHTYTRKIVA